MNVCNSTLDIISNLPTNIVENILMCLPLRDAVRTSILSKKWRYKWRYLPQLVFDRTFNLTPPSKLWFSIYQVLLLHRGPLLKFTLSIPRLTSCPEIDQLISFLSGKDIQQFTLDVVSRNNRHKLPSSLFSCLQLRHLSLSSCIFTPPPTCIGFSGLISLKFQKVSVVADFVQNFISKCPLLEELSLRYCTNIDRLEISAPNLKYFYFRGLLKYISFQSTPLLATALIYSSEGPARFNGSQTSDMIKFFGGLHVIENLCLDYSLLEYLGLGNIPARLPSILNHLKRLELHHICLDIVDEVSYVLCLIRSSPNLQKLRIVVLPSTDTPNPTPDPICQLLKALDLSDGSLNRLQKVRIESFNGTIPELEFVKFLLTNSSLLETMHIQTSVDMVTDDRFKILRKITRFPRASTKAEILYYNRDEDLDRVYC